MKKHIIPFIAQTLALLALRIMLIIAGLFIQIPIIAWIRYRMKTEVPSPNRFDESYIEHLPQYKLQGSSGYWQFWDAPKWLAWFGNYEDGYLGEPSGKWSAARGGNERSFLSMYLWSAIRNPVNTFSRDTKWTACYPEKCDIQWKGNTRILRDRHPVIEGWYFVKATERYSGRNYYGFRFIHYWGSGPWEKKVAHIRIGFKIIPTHAGQSFEPDDKAKGWTFRASLAVDPGK